MLPTLIPNEESPTTTGPNAVAHGIAARIARSIQVVLIGLRVPAGRPVLLSRTTSKDLRHPLPAAAQRSIPPSPSWSSLRGEPR